jgi:hypothetical protein
MIEIHGGLAVTDGKSAIRGLVISAAPLILETNGRDTLRRNYIGTAATGRLSGGVVCCPSSRSSSERAQPRCPLRSAYTISGIR